MIINTHYPYLSITRELTWAEIKARAQAGNPPMTPGDSKVDGNLTCWYLGTPTENLQNLGNMIFCIDLGTTQWYPGIEYSNARWMGCNYARSPASASYPTFSGIYDSMSADLKAVLNTGTVRYRQISNSGVTSMVNRTSNLHALAVSDFNDYFTTIGTLHPVFENFLGRTFVTADPINYRVTYKTSTDTTTTSVTYHTWIVSSFDIGNTAYTEVQAPNSDVVTGDTTGDVLLIFGI